MASHSLQAIYQLFSRLPANSSSPIHRSSPLGYRRSACSPRNRGERGPFSNGYMIVYGGLKNCSSTIHIPGHQYCRSIAYHSLAAEDLWPELTPDDLCKEEQLTGFIQRTRSLAIIRPSLSSFYSSSRSRSLFTVMSRTIILVGLGRSIEWVGCLDRSRGYSLRSSGWGGQESDGSSWESRDRATE